MNKYKIYENPDEFIELSEEELENILLKNVTDSNDCEYTQFIFTNFKSNWLKSEIAQKIYKICNAYWVKYEKLPNENTIIKIFENKKWEDSASDLKKEYNNIVSFDTSKFNNAFIKDAIVKFIKNKALYWAMLNSIEEINKDGYVGNIIGQFENILKIDLNNDLGIEYFKNLDKHCEDISKTTDRTPFGFRELDHYTYGGLPTYDTCLFLLMAQPGLGKSQLMMNIAYHWILNNKKVLVVSLEMSEDMYSRRFDALFADLSPNTLKDNIPLLKSRVKGVKANIPRGELRIKEFPTGTLTTALLKQYLKNLKSIENFDPDIIFVDYLNIMRPNSYGASTTLYEKCAKISEELRALSGEKKIPIVSAIQSNRCLLNSTIVKELNKGYIKISELKEGDFILSNKQKYNKVIKIYPEIKQIGYKIITKSGKEIVGSGNHIWPTSNGNKTIETGLKIGDKLIKRTLFDCIADIIGKIINIFK